MAKLKIKFTEDQIKLIKALRFEQINPKFYVTPAHEDVSVEEVGNTRFNVISWNRMGNGGFETVAPITVQNAMDLGDNLYGIDSYNLWGGTYILEDMALILGKMDKLIEGTSEDPDGPKFDEETTQYFFEMANFIVDNLCNIEEILHQFCTEGIQADTTYSCKPNEHIWHKEE